MPNVTSPTRRRAAALLAMMAALLVAGVVPALAHGGVIPQPVVDSVPDGVPGLEAVGTVAYAPRIKVTNPSDEVLTVVDDSGRPWLQISGDGVSVDRSVRAWSESLDSSGRGVDVDPSVPSEWTKVSALPTWEWFDTDLLPRADDDDAHTWSIPVVVDGQLDQITGTLEESDLEGRWTTDLQESGDIGGARVSVISGPIPVFVVQLLEADEVIVRGRFDEPVLRLTSAGFEVNLASPTWNDHARLDPASEVGTVVEDPDAEPVWAMQLADAPTATWLDSRAATGFVTPSKRSEGTLETVVQIDVDGVPHDVPVITEWLGDAVPLLGITMTIPTLIAASLGAGLLAAGIVRAWERRREDAVDGDDVADDALVTPATDDTTPD